ncbi:hypothetical protein FPV67DRAFT_581937 [Lyophyllum atratum]|nr:hypothetical protein FPV67DRAFT_581937 [Lyophyllum atratum]
MVINSRIPRSRHIHIRRVPSVKCATELMERGWTRIRPCLGKRLLDMARRLARELDALLELRKQILQGLYKTYLKTLGAVAVIRLYAGVQDLAFSTFDPIIVADDNIEINVAELRLDYGHPTQPHPDMAGGPEGTIANVHFKRASQPDASDLDEGYRLLTFHFHATALCYVKIWIGRTGRTGGVLRSSGTERSISLNANCQTSSVPPPILRRDSGAFSQNL